MILQIDNFVIKEKNIRSSKTESRQMKKTLPLGAKKQA
jgi:hypothetical protein